MQDKLAFKPTSTDVDAKIAVLGDIDEQCRCIQALERRKLEGQLTAQVVLEQASRRTTTTRLAGLTLRMSRGMRSEKLSIYL